MPLPTKETLMLPILRLLARQPMRIQDLATALANEFSLSADERARTIPSSHRVTVIQNRTGWARTELKQAGLVAQPQRGGPVEITDRGRALLAEDLPRIDARVLSRYPEFVAFRKASAGSSLAGSAESGSMSADNPIPDATPDERIDQAIAEVNHALQQDLLDRLKAGEPRYFERVVVDLLLALGYGAGSDGASEVTGRSGDGGIDGVIDEDHLGLDRIHVQAKRFKEASVGAPVVHAFIGALHMRGASKGVLLTTSTFTKAAHEAARANPSTRVVLIDGDRLAELMVRHNVGVRTERTVEIKKLDFDYFEPDGT